MCGIVGYWGRQCEPAAIASAMADKISHRGPDSSGVWVDKDAGFALGHRRLAIVDLSSAGAQPMISSDGRYILSYNGEIYNHQDIRRELESRGTIKWRGESDTETLLEAISTWGLKISLQKSNGMFAFALWDRKTHRLFLARDRMGEKPLYWGRLNGDLVFSSELKALKVHPAWTGDVNRDVLSLYLRHNYVPAPHSIHPGIFKLPAAHWLEIGENGRNITEPMPYWSVEDALMKGISKPFIGTEADAATTLEHLLKNSVRQRMLSDVPLGAFLSGGYDSSLIVALMQAQSTRPVQTFSIGFHDSAYNEAEHASAVAKHIGTDHTELYLHEKELLDSIPTLPKIWDEPFSDSSQIPTLLVSRLAKKNVTVCLSGDGGDELFCGYDRYRLAQSFWSKFGHLPPVLRKGISLFLKQVISPTFDFVGKNSISDRLERAAGLLAFNDREAFYRSLVSHFDNPESLVLGAKEEKSFFSNLSDWPDIVDFRDQMMYVDQKTYLTDDILTKVDRASMSVSLETRVPFLDHDLIEFAWSLPIDFKTSGTQFKKPLREVLYKHVPRALMDRPKMGFKVPMDAWLKGPLRPWAEELLSEKRLREDGFFDPTATRNLWKSHLKDSRRRHTQIWSILMFQAWRSEV